MTNDKMPLPGGYYLYECNPTGDGIEWWMANPLNQKHWPIGDREEAEAFAAAMNAAALQPQPSASEAEVAREIINAYRSMVSQDFSHHAITPQVQSILARYAATLTAGKDVQPIKTAPAYINVGGYIEGIAANKRFLAYYPDDGWCTVRRTWTGGFELAPDGGTEFHYEFTSEPTHWMPEPAMPAIKEPK